MSFAFQQSFLRSADGGGTPGGAAAAAAAAARTADAGASPPAAGGGGKMLLDANGGTAPAAPGPWKSPDFLPEPLRADTPEAAYDKLAGDWKRLRDTVAAMPGAPKSADEYKYTPSDKAKPFLGDPANDPVFGIAREAALAAGLPAQTFEKFIGGLYDTMADKGMLPKPYSPAEQRRAFLGDRSANMTDAQTLDAIKPQLVGAIDWLQGLSRNGTIDAAGAAALMDATDTAAGLKAIVALHDKLAPKGLNPGGAAPGGGDPMAEVRRREADPRANRNRVEYDQKFANETFEMRKKAHR